MAGEVAETVVVELVCQVADEGGLSLTVPWKREKSTAGSVCTACNKDGHVSLFLKGGPDDDKGCCAPSFPVTPIALAFPRGRSVRVGARSYAGAWPMRH